MFHFTLDAYGTVNRPATQNVAGGQSALLNPNEPKPAAEAKVVAKPAIEIDQVVLTTAVNRMNQQLSPALQTIEFSLEQDSARMIVKVIDTASKTVIEQIPNNKVLALSKTLDSLQDILIRQTA